MEKKEITIDINKLDTDQLRVLAEMTYRNGDMQTTKEINDRIKFIEY